MIRPIAPSDQERLKRSFERLGADSRYRRFLGAKASLNDRELVYFTDVDHHDHEAVVAEQSTTGDILGIARFVRAERNSSVAEVGLAAIRALFRELGPTVTRHVGSGTTKVAVNLTDDHAVGELARAA